MTSKRAIDLNELPRWSKWPARLLGLQDWAVPARTVEKIDSEYDKDKYARCLEFHTQRGAATTFEQVKDFELGMSLSETVCYSDGPGLYLATLGDAWGEYCRLMVDCLREGARGAGTVVELGAGFGYNGYLLGREIPGLAYAAGDYSRNAVGLARRLYAGQGLTKFTAEEFNFYEPGTYEALLGPARPPVFVFTAGAIEQLPSAAAVLDGLRRYKQKIAAVVHLEPAYELHDDGLLGLMRRRYAQANDYNRDLVSTVKRQADVRLTRADADVFGLPPLNPISVLRWEFAR